MDPQPTNREIQKLISNEFEDRRSPEEALENIRLLISDKNREVPRAEGPPPKMSKQSEEQDFPDSDVEEEEPTKEEESAEIDSDGDGIEIIDEVGDDKESIEPFDVLTLDVVKKVYRNLGRNEIRVITENDGGRVVLKKILKLLHISKLTPIKPVKLPIGRIKVYIGHRQITMEISHDRHDTTSIDYEYHRDGCLFKYNGYNGTSVLVKGIKYHSLAAKDLFYLVRHPEAKFKVLGIHITRHVDPVIDELRSFFCKMNAYFLNLSHKIKVTELFITTFQDGSVPNSAQSFISMFWNFLEPKVLKTAKVRVWKNRDVVPDWNILKDLYATEQWQHLKQLDICDYGIKVEEKDWVHLWHIDRIKSHNYLPHINFNLPGSWVL